MDLPVFFVSYARQDSDLPKHRDGLLAFVEELEALVASRLGISRKGVAFLDSDIRSGQIFTDEIRDALMRCKVGVPLYSAGYFSRRWCGQEFQVFLDRRPVQGGHAVVPVRWEKEFELPACASKIQIEYEQKVFPIEYASMGMRPLAVLRESVMAGPYSMTLEVLADRIVSQAKAAPLASLAALDMEKIESAWEAEAANDPRSHTQGNISKTCFVFVSGNGWDWIPYHGTPVQIGALAQKISGELGLRYEEITCDAALPRKLQEANDHNVPTVLFGDPTSLGTNAYAKPMQEYDKQYLLNCASLIVWEPGVRDSIETDPRWVCLKTQVMRQKVANPPPHHELRSIFSHEELDQKTRTSIEQIRSRLMKQLISEPTGGAIPLKAENASIAANAAAIGIPTTTLSHLEGPTQ